MEVGRPRNTEFQYPCSTNSCRSQEVLYDLDKNPEQTRYEVTKCALDFSPALHSVILGADHYLSVGSC